MHLFLSAWYAYSCRYLHHIISVINTPFLNPFLHSDTHTHACMRMAKRNTPCYRNEKLTLTNTAININPHPYSLKPSTEMAALNTEAGNANI